MFCFSFLALPSPASFFCSFTPRLDSRHDHFCHYSTWTMGPGSRSRRWSPASYWHAHLFKAGSNDTVLLFVRRAIAHIQLPDQQSSSAICGRAWQQPADRRRCWASSRTSRLSPWCTDNGSVQKLATSCRSSKRAREVGSGRHPASTRRFPSQGAAAATATGCSVSHVRPQLSTSISPSRSHGHREQRIGERATSGARAERGVGTHRRFDPDPSASIASRNAASTGTR